MLTGTRSSLRDRRGLLWVPIDAPAVDRKMRVKSVSVSIIVPSRGGAARLPQLFGALRAQTVRNWEAVVVLDGDIDDSERICRAAAGNLPVRTIVFPENEGRSRALNAGFAAATGDILVRCDDDLVPAPDYVAQQIAEHADGPVGVIGLYRNIFPDTPYASVYGRPNDERFRREAYAKSADAVWHYWAGNASISRSTYEKVGEYDPRFRAYGYEDVDMGYRLYQLGVRIHLSPELETNHMVAATTTRVRVKRAYYSGSARRVFEDKHALPPVEHQAGLWSKSVKHAARRAELGALMRRAENLDKRLPRLPGWLGQKLVAHLVETAAGAGYGHAVELQADF
ncbi:hypothetical protein GCM10027427_04460 [Pseudoclavibacter terrae]